MLFLNMVTLIYASCKHKQIDHQVQETKEMASTGIHTRHLNITEKSFSIDAF
jgi:hypothetical protein